MGSPYWKATLEEYDELEESFQVLRESGEAGSREDNESWRIGMALQAQNDLYFLMRCVLSTGDATNRFKDDHFGGKRFIEHPFAYEMARFAQEDYDGVMSMAGRGHGKSVTYDFALNFFLYVNHPEWRFCIWSITRNLAKSHLRAIRNEIESNRLLPILWPDLFYQNRPPAKARTQASAWSLDDGLAMPKLPPNSDSMTFEAWGLTDVAFPTGHHFHHMCFDDVVDERVISSPEMIVQARETHDRAGGVEMPSGCSRTYIGTPYADNDTGVQLIEEGVVRLRARPAVDPLRRDTDHRRQLGGAPIFLSEEMMLKKLKDMGQNYWSQMCLDPNKGRTGKFVMDSIRTYKTPPHEERYGKNVYICVDPNGGFDPTRNDPMAMTVWGLGGDKNFYLLDAYLGHMNPGERHRFIIEKRAEWDPIDVRIEEMTIGSDSYWLRDEMEKTGHRFEISSVRVETMRKGSGAKGTWTRVQRLTEAWEPVVSASRIYLPERLEVLVAGEPVDLAHAFREELRRFPIAKSDNLISAGALLFADHGGKRGAQPLAWPAPMSGLERNYPHYWTPNERSSSSAPRSSGWMGRG